MTWLERSKRNTPSSVLSGVGLESAVDAFYIPKVKQSTYVSADGSATWKLSLRRRFRLAGLGCRALITRFHLAVFLPQRDRNQGVSVGDDLVLNPEEAVLNAVGAALEERGGRSSL